MEFKRKGMILISMLFIFMLSIGMVSASEDFNTSINNDYPSDMNIENSIDAIDNVNYEKTNMNIGNSIDAIDNVNYEKTNMDINYESLEKSKDKLYDDDSVEDDPNDPYDPYEPDPFEDELFLSYELSKPVNGINYIEGEEITITYHLEDASGEDASGDYYINICEFDLLIDDIVPFSINGTSNFTISKYYPVGNYTLYLGNYFTDEASGETTFGIMDGGLNWNEGYDESPDFLIKTNYNKEVYANLTIGYNIVETYNITEGDSIIGGVKLEDEFGNRLNDNTYITLYKYDEDEGEYVNFNQDNYKTSNGLGKFRFDNLGCGEYYVTVEYIEHADEFDNYSYEYTNIKTEPIHFSVIKDPNDYIVNLNKESGEITTNSSYEIGIQILDPHKKTYEGPVEIYKNETKIAEINISYTNGDYCNYTINELNLGINNITVIYKINDKLNASKSIQIIRYGANLELSSLDKNNVLANLTDIDSNPIQDAIIQITVNGKASSIQTNENGTCIIPINGNSTVKARYVNTLSKEVLISTIEVIHETEVLEKNNTIIINNTVEVPKEVPVEIPVEVPVNATISTSTEDGSSVIVKLTDIDGKAISNAIIKLNINGEDSKITTGTDGTTKIFIKGNNTIVASYTTASNNNISSSINIIVINKETIKEKNNTIIINNSIKRAGTKIDYKDMTTVAVNTASDGRVGEYFNVTLRDSAGNALANKKVQIGFNGKIYNRTTDAKGFTQLQINLAREDIYTFAVAFLGDDEYNGSFAVSKITVKKQSPKLTTSNKSYKASAKTKTLTATFKTALGNPVKGKEIIFTVNGKSYKGTTNAKGLASVKVSLSKKGTYSFTAKYAGDNTFKATSKSGKLTIN